MNDVIEIRYVYQNYSDSELNRFIKLALSDISSYSGEHYEVESTNIYPKMDIRTQSLVAKIAMIRINPDYSVYNTPNLTLRYPKTDDAEAKIQKIITYHFSGSEYNGVIELN